MTVTAGSIGLHDRARPDVGAGSYTVRLEQTVAEFAATPVERRLEVVAPRFALPGPEVAATFPPHQATGAFDTRLAQIVLKRRSLPWERRLGSTGAAAAQPWLALVLLTADEAEFRTAVPVTEVIPADLHAALGVGPGSGVCDCVQTSAEVVRAVFPRLDEVGLLCHVREVSLADTELAAGDDDGFFAVVLSARLPRRGQAYTAYLISLEGRAAVLPAAGGVADTPGAATVPPAGPLDQRFPVLARWSFTVDTGGDFESLATGLDVGAFGTAPAGTPGVTPTGHVLTGHRSRRGERRSAWYRGPLTPRAVARREPVPLFGADQARRIATDGLEDLSEAAAFEAGRLLAMADPEFVAAVGQWRRAEFQTAIAAETFGYVPGVTDLGLAPAELRTEAPGRLALSALLSLGSDAAPLGDPVPLHPADRPLTGAERLRIADGLGLDPDLVKTVLLSGLLDRPALPAAAGPDWSAVFATVVADPAQRAHLQQSLAQQVAAVLRDAGLAAGDGFDPAAPAGSLDDVFSGGNP